ncbi:H(+)-transporting V0 sector ATPase subunit a, partial [Podila horticola]
MAQRSFHPSIPSPTGGEYVPLESIPSQPTDNSNGTSTSASTSTGGSSSGTLTSRLRANPSLSSDSPEETSGEQRPLDPYQLQESTRNLYRNNGKSRITMAESTFFRSEEMSLIQLYIPAEVAQPTVSELGELGLVQFRDLNPDVNAFQRAFVNEIRRFDEMERQLRFFTGQIEKADIHVRTAHPSAYQSLTRSRQELDDLEDRLSEHENRLLQMNNSHETMQRRYLELTELKHVLRETSDFFQEAASHQDEIRNSFDEPHAPLLDDLETGPSQEAQNMGLALGNVTGVIPRSKMQTFERILWRSLRGN